MERRIVGIIRWLERCLSACRAGAMESALMDVECARADLERLREDVWTSLERKHAVRTRKHFLPAPMKGVVLALAVVLAAAAPLAVFQEERRSEPAVSLEWVTPDEKMLLGNLRRHLSESNSSAALPGGGEREEGVKTRAEGIRASAMTGTKSIETRSAPPTESRSKSEAEVPYDQIITLLQAGERALKNERPLIRIERQ